MTKNSPKADIDFERDLWKAADELRGAVAENQYKDYVLSLIFIKHLSERYEIRKDELKHELDAWRDRTNDPLLKHSNLLRLKAEVNACIVDGEAKKERLTLTYPDYFFSSSEESSTSQKNE